MQICKVKGPNQNPDRFLEEQQNEVEEDIKERDKIKGPKDCK